MDRTPFDQLDNALAKLDAFIRLISHFQDMEPADRPSYAEGEGFLVEVMMAESHHARAAFDHCWQQAHTANDRRAS